MSQLIVSVATDPEIVLRRFDRPDEIARELGPRGVHYEHWETVGDLPDAATPELALDYYLEPISHLKEIGVCGRADVVHIRPNDRANHVSSEIEREHAHDEDEANFVAEGSGSFWFHFDDCLIECRCARGDLLFIPKSVRHWFQPGPEPDFVIVRVFKGDPAALAQRERSLSAA